MGATAITTGRCAECGRAYQGNAARPRWAFTHDGALVGSVHTYHTAKKGYRYWTADGDQSADAALFDVWKEHVRGWPDGSNRESDDWYAFLLASQPTAVLSDAQRERLDWWIETGPLKMGVARGERILVAHAALVRDFQAWRKRLDRAKST